MNIPGGYISLKEWDAIQRRKGLSIDPEAAEVRWYHIEKWDPYGVGPLPEEEVDRVYYVRNLGSDIWVNLCDLPDETLMRLTARVASGELQEKQFLGQRIREVMRGERLDDQLEGLESAMIRVLEDEQDMVEPRSPEQRASRLREIADNLISKMARTERAPAQRAKVGDASNGNVSRKAFTRGVPDEEIPF